MKNNYLILDLEAPMISFGGEVVDNYGVVRDFPAKSMLTGLMGNALGLDRSDSNALDTLQSRITSAAALVRPGYRRREYQTARLFENETGWTTSGEPEGRSKSPSFSWDLQYENQRDERRKSLTHQRYRDYDLDARTLVAISLVPTSDGPDIRAIASALATPCRPLFIGRKACIPSRPVLLNVLESTDILSSLARAMSDCGFFEARVQWCSELEVVINTYDNNNLSSRLPYQLQGQQKHTICDERRHKTGVHGGKRQVYEATLSIPSERAGEDALEVHSLSALFASH